MALAAIITAAVAMNSCETEVDLLAPYKSVPVVIGVLDHTVDTQFFRINRTFLGEGDANLFANIKDSVEYPIDAVDAWLIKYQIGSGLVNDPTTWTKLDSIKLLPIELPSRNPGVFYNTNVRMYHTTQPLFTGTQAAPNNIANFRYMFRLRVEGKTYRAITDFPTTSQSNITAPQQSQGNLVPLEFVFSNTYRTVPFRINIDPGAARYESVVRIVFDYRRTDGTLVTNQHIDYNLGVANNAAGATDNRDINMPSEAWYQFVGPIFRGLPNVQQVRIARLEFRLTGGNRELNSYINVAQPISQFVPVLSTYTNLSGGAIGIVGSKVTVARPFGLTNQSLAELLNGPYTSGPAYCITWQLDSPFSCPP
jgi:hypothetical protein